MLNNNWSMPQDFYPSCMPTNRLAKKRSGCFSSLPFLTTDKFYQELWYWLRPWELNPGCTNYIGVTENINKAIKATARTITKSRLSDKIRSEVLLQKAGLKCLNEAVASITAVTVWKSKTFMDPLGQCIFRGKPSFQCTRSVASKDIGLLVPGYPTLSTNIMVRIWNAVPGFMNILYVNAPLWKWN